MKKLATLALVALTLAACKKDPKTEGKTSETIKTENPAKSADTPEQQAQPIQAITDSAGVYTLKYKLEKGKTYPFVMIQKNNESVDLGGKKQSQSNSVTDNISFTVTNYADGVYTFDVLFNSKKQVGTTPDGKSITLDTQGAEPKEEQLKALWKVNKAMMGHKVQLKMKDNGEILNITGFDPIYKAVTKAINTTVKDEKTRKGLLEGFKNSFNEEVLKSQFQMNLNFFPSKGLKVGESYTETENLDPEGKLKSKTTFTLAKIDDQYAHFSVKGNIPKKSNKETKNGITSTVSISGSQTGSIKLNTKTGWMDNAKVTIKSTQSQTLSKGEQSQTATHTSVATTTINP